MNRRGALVCLVLFPVAVHLYMHAVFSHQQVFDQIKVGSPESAAEGLLASAGIACAASVRVVTAQNPPPGYCFFSDPWREYGLNFDLKTHTVRTKYVAYTLKPRAPARLILLKILDWVRHG